MMSAIATLAGVCVCVWTIAFGDPSNPDSVNALTYGLGFMCGGMLSLMEDLGQ